MAPIVTLPFEQSDEPKVYSYVRFSTPEQSKGDSRRRQTDAAQAYAAVRGMTVDETLSDDGLSGYRAKHLAESGQLGTFLLAISTGLVAPGSVLLVENIDRLSRQPPWRTATLLSNIVQAGVTVVTLNPEREYSAAVLDHESNGVMTFIELSLQAHRAHTESVTKGSRLRDAWTAKRQRALTGEKLTATCPPWLTLNASRDGFTVHEARADVVRRIFRDTLAGVGSHAITVALNAEGVPPFSLTVDDEGKAIYSENAGKAAVERQRFWRRTYLSTILRNPAVIGVQTLSTGDHTTGKRVKLAVGTVDDYFPAIVSAADFHAVQAMVSTKSPRRGRHAMTAVSNIFGGLGVCSRCGSTVIRVNKGKAGTGLAYLVCERAKSGGGCSYASVPYAKAEAAFLHSLSFILAEAPQGEQAAKLTKERRNLETYLGVLGDQYDDAFRSMRTRRSPETAQTLRRLESERDALQVQLKAIDGRLQQHSSGMVQQRVDALWDVCMREPFDRTAVNACMRRVFTAIQVDPDSKMITPTFAPSGDGPSFFYAPDEASSYGFTNEPEGTYVQAPKTKRKRKA